jgi:large subunit ribosomal protein L17
MIHRRKGRKLKRTASHRKATLSNLSVSLINFKKITTTLAKAKELRTFIEPLITKAKKSLITKENGTSKGIHLRREVNKVLNDKGAVKTLFTEIAPKVSERNGGYTRVLKLGRRFGDSAELAIIELVDYNIEQSEQKSKEKQTSETISKASSKKVAKPAKKKTKKEAVKEDH